ncbi:winged helix-turn-helix domain-containing protein [Pseudomonas sp. S31]|uniref:winged helix-turn-helix domain-containing protein n=1 Tax=Pseudomonas sp. S31 TaxID=1564473 RepID=UPI0019119272
MNQGLWLSLPITGETFVQFQVLDLNVDLDKREISCGGGRVRLSSRPFGVLVLLAKNCESIVSREKLLDEVWGLKFDPGTKVVDVQLTRLRRELKDIGCSAKIMNLRSAGFKLCT